MLLLPTGFPTDMRGWLETAYFVATYGIGHVYDTYQQANAYPPLYFWPLRFAATLPDPELALRLLAIVADAACAYLALDAARGPRRVALRAQSRRTRHGGMDGNDR